MPNVSSHLLFQCLMPVRTGTLIMKPNFNKNLNKLNRKLESACNISSLYLIIDINKLNRKLESACNISSLYPIYINNMYI